MTDDDVERRLRTLLAGRADQLDPALSGPELRARAAKAHRPMTRFVAPALAAAAVVVVAVASQTLGHPASHPRPQLPGRPGTVTHSVPILPPIVVPTVAPSVLPSVRPSVPAAPRPTTHAAPTARPTPARSAPSRTPTATHAPLPPSVSAPRSQRTTRPPSLPQPSIGPTSVSPAVSLSTGR